MVVHRSLLPRRWCRELAVRRWWNQTSIPHHVIWRCTSPKNSKVLLTIPDELGAELQRINGYFYALCQGGKHTLQYWPLPGPYANSALTTVGVQLDNNAIPAPYTAAISTLLVLYDRGGDVLLDYPIWIIVSRGRFVWQLLDLCWLFVYTAGWCPGSAANWSFVNWMSWYTSFCNAAGFSPLQCAGILCLMDCGSPSMKILLRTYLSKTCGPLGVLSQNEFANPKGDIVIGLKYQAVSLSVSVMISSVVYICKGWVTTW